MVNFNIEGMDFLKDFNNLDMGGFLTTFGILAVFFAILIAIALIFLWVFGSLGIMNLAKKNNISNAWLAFLPIGRSYIIAKLGFEVYADEKKKNQNFTWITLALAAAAFVLNNNNDLHELVNLALLVFEVWAFYNIFKALNSKNATLYTIFTVITGTLFGGIFLYLMKTDNPLPENEVKENKKEEVKQEKIESKASKEKKEEVVNFCENCGFKLNKNAKFCPECGKKIK